MTDFYQRRSADLNPRGRTNMRPGGVPAPTGYYRDMTGVNQAPAIETGVCDELYRDWGTVGRLTDEKVDQHPYMQVSATLSPAPAGPRRDGRNDPLVDGLPAPTPRLLGLFYRRAAGTSHTRLDDVPGHVFPKVGSQDGASTTWAVDPAVAMAPYNLDANGEQPDSLKKVRPSPAHGWTAQPVFNVKATENRKAVQLIQQKNGRQDRLAASTYSGQSYSSRTAHVANGPGAAPTPSRRHRG